MMLFERNLSHTSIEAEVKEVKFGRKPPINHDRIIEMTRQGIGTTKIARKLSISRSTVY